MEEKHAVDVTQALLSLDEKDLLFKIVTKFEDGSTSTVMRNHREIEWIHQQLSSSHKNKILPSLPEAPSSSSLKETEYLEKKRRQIHRYITKLVSRPEFWNSPELKSFFTSPTVTISQDAFLKTASTAINTLLAKYDNGIRLYKPIFVVPEKEKQAEVEEEKDFERKKAAVLQSEQDFKNLIDSVASMIRARNMLGKNFHQTCQAISELQLETEEKSGSAWGDDPILRPFNEFGIHMNSFSHDHAKDEIFLFAEVILEYKNNSNVKALLNHRTDALVDYEDAARNYNRSLDNFEKLKKKQVPDNSPEIIAANEEIEKTNQRQMDLAQKYEIAKKDVAREYDRYQATKIADFKSALSHFTTTQIDYEKKKLDIMQQLKEQFAPKKAE